MTDPIVEAVRQKLLYRSEVGQKKYGCTVEGANLTLLQALIHAQQETMDASVYLEQAIQLLSGRKT